MFRASLRPSSEATTIAAAASGLPSELGDSSVVRRGRAGRPDHDQYNNIDNNIDLTKERQGRRGKQLMDNLNKKRGY